MKSFSRMLLAFGLSVLLVNALWGQGFTATIHATDGSSNHVDLVIGDNPLAVDSIAVNHAVSNGPRNKRLACRGAIVTKLRVPTGSCH